jgi:hypothetical protein
MFETVSEFKNKVANLPQDVGLGTGWFGFCFFIPAVWQVQIVKRRHFFDFPLDGCENHPDR